MWRYYTKGGAIPNVCLDIKLPAVEYIHVTC